MMQTYWLVGKAKETMTEERNDSLAEELKKEMEKYMKESASKSVKVTMGKEKPAHDVMFVPS